MMRNVKRVLSAVTAVAIMSVGMSSMSAGAATETWCVREQYGAPGNVNVHTDAHAWVNGSSKKSTMTESCTYVQYCMSEGGQSSRARYHGYYEYVQNGVTYKMETFKSKYHTVATQASHTITLTNAIPAYATYYVNYYLEYYTSGNCWYSGQIG